MVDLDLSLVSIEDMIKELEKRFDAMVMVGLQDRTTRHELSWCHWSGGGPVCVGMARILEQRIMHDWEDKTPQGTDDDL